MSNQKRKQKIYLSSNGEKNCFFCGRFFGKQCTLDHVFPKSRFRKNDGVNFMFKYVLCCQRCNVKKGNRNPTEKELVKFKKLIQKRLSYNDLDSNRLFNVLKTLY